MAGNFVKLDRKILEWPWYSDVNTKTLFIHCLLKANWQEKRWKGYVCKRELFFRWCPYCKGGGHDKNTFSVNLTNGVFKCFRAGCGQQGHLVQLARDFGYPLAFDDGRKKKYLALPQRPVKTTSPAVAYLESRGISRAVTERYRITTQRGRDNILVFPFYDGDGVLQFVKYRKTDFKRGRDI